MTHLHSARHGQRGISLMGLMFWAVLIAFVGTVLIKVVPTLQEYMAIRNTVRRITDGPSPTAADIRASFEKQKIIEYGITSISGRDLQIETSGDKLVVRFAYDKEIEIFDPVYLLIKYQGSATTR